MLSVINMFEQFFMTAIIVTAVFGAVLGITGCANKADAEVVVPDEEKTMIVLPQHEDVYATYNVPMDYDLQVYIIQTCEELNIDAAWSWP